MAQDRPLASLPYTPSLETKFLDRSADPCVDFYKFSCGNWNKLNPIPADQPRWDVYAKLTDDNQRFLWGILEEAAKPGAGRTAAQQKIGDYFAACMDEAAIEKAGATPLQPRLDEIAALKSVADIPPLLARMHLESGDDSPLFAFSSSQDFADSSRVIAFASPAAWACRTATTTSIPTPSRRRSAPSTWSTWRAMLAIAGRFAGAAAQTARRP